MLAADERLGVDLVHVLGARWAGGEPAVRRRDLEPADRGAVAGRWTGASNEDSRAALHDERRGEPEVVLQRRDTPLENGHVEGSAGQGMCRASFVPVPKLGEAIHCWCSAARTRSDA